MKKKTITEKKSVRRVWENSISRCLNNFENTLRKWKIEKESGNNKKKNQNQKKVSLSIGY